MTKYATHMKGKITILLLVSLMILTGCKKDDDNPGKITIPDNTELPPGTIITIITEDGEEIKVTPGASIDVEPGTYRIVVTKNSEGVTIKKTIASLPASSGGEVPQAPALLADVIDVTVTNDQVFVPGISLKPMTREVQVRVNIAGLNPDKIASVKVTLYGVGNTIDLAQGFGSVAATESVYHTSMSMQGYQPASILAMHIMGIAPGGSPRIKIEVTTKDGQVHELQQDVTQALAGFNTGDPTQPVLLNADLTVTTEVGMTGTIKPWKPGWEGEIDGF